MEVTHEQFQAAVRENALTVARRIRSNALKIIGKDLEFDCGDNILAKVMQQRLALVMEAIDEGMTFAAKL